MRHGVKKLKIRAGKDANDMLLRKMVSNFISNGKMVTTLTKAKVMQPFIDRLVEKSKTKTEANKNYLLRYFPVKKFMSIMVDQVGPALQDKHGGYTRIIRLNTRESDGVLMSRLEWAHPVVIEVEEVKAPKKVKDLKTAKEPEKETKTLAK